MNSQQLQEFVAEFERAEYEVMGFKEGEFTDPTKPLGELRGVADMLGLKAARLPLPTCSST